MKISIVLTSLWLGVAASAAQAHGSMNFKGSDGGIVRTIVTSQNEPHVVYAATSQAGVFRSGDGGKHWLPVNNGLPRVDVLALVLDATAPATLYAGTRNGLFKTADSGATWQPAGAALGKEQVKVLLQDGNDAKTLYAGTYHGLWKSTDAGVTWLRLPNQPENSNISALTIAHDATRTLYAGTAEGLFRSRDGGVTWVRSSKGLSVPAIAILVLDPTRPQTLYAGTGDGAYRSDDAGETWRSITFSKTNLPVTALLVDPHHPDTIYLGTSFVGGFFKTEDAGKSWTRIQGETFTPSITALVFSPEDPQGLIAGTSFYAEVFTSPDAGMTWNTRPDALALPALESLSGTPDGEFIYAAAHDGVYRFNSALQNWKWIGDAGVGTLSRAAYLKRKTPVLWVCGSKGVAEGRLRKEVWTFSRRSSAKDCIDLTLNEQTGRVVAVTKTGVWTGPGHWQHRPVPAREEAIHQIALSKNGKVIYALTEHRVLRSADEGKTWERVDENAQVVFTGVAETGTAPAVTWVASTSGIVYQAEGKWISSSQGMFPPSVGAITASSNGDRLYAASLVLGRVFARQPNENTWSASDIEGGAPDMSDLRADPMHEGVLYAATRNSGLFRSDDHGQHWVAVNAGLARPAQAASPTPKAGGVQ